MREHPTRRRWLVQTGGLVAAGAWGVAARAQEKKPASTSIVGHPAAAKAGAEVLATGGNAVDAAVAAALVAGVVAIHQCGIGGYGGHMVIAPLGGRKVTAIDFNTTAPASARENLFTVDEKGQVKDRANQYGWLSVGVPGTLAGLQLAVDRYGTQSFSALVRPAIEQAQKGFVISEPLSTAIRVSRAQLARDPATAALLLEKGEAPKAGTLFRNPELAEMLRVLASRKSVQSFYQGDIAKKLAAAFKQHGGLVTAEDLAAYRAREVEPLALTWGDQTIWTAPLTAGGTTVLETLQVLKALDYAKRPPRDPATLHALVEALRLAWDDRLKFLGDPEKAKVPLARLLSEAHAKELAGKVETAVRDRKLLPLPTDGAKTDGGTIHLSVVDVRGMMVALTLTHGGYFGAQVTVPGLGLLLGHGMSRFEPRPNHPNSPGSGKRPLHNMCPTIVTRGGNPILAVGGTGGRRIPNAVLTVLTHLVARGAALEDAVSAPRLHTEGDAALNLEPGWSKEDVEYLKKIGYTTRTGPSATIHAVITDPKTGHCRSASR